MFLITVVEHYSFSISQRATNYIISPSRRCYLVYVINLAMQVKLMDLLVHASRCRATKSNPCPLSGCHKIRQLFRHAHGCTIRLSGGCDVCNKIWLLLRMHSRKCEDSSCLVPRCRYVLFYNKLIPWVMVHIIR